VQNIRLDGDDELLKFGESVTIDYEKMDKVRNLYCKESNAESAEEGHPLLAAMEENKPIWAPKTDSKATVEGDNDWLECIWSTPPETYHIEEKMPIVFVNKKKNDGKTRSPFIIPYNATLEGTRGKTNVSMRINLLWDFIDPTLLCGWGASTMLSAKDLSQEEVEFLRSIRFHRIHRLSNPNIYTCCICDPVGGLLA